uniref:peptidoglycan-binding domain-containing protein n=1 Tax=Trichocoleus desertorum TaxID=1481672 RepID=UPI0025B3492F|nr:peptidoglycan-binding protein [Trichocoleus desertorum]
MESSPGQGLAAPHIICSQILRWSTISLLTASLLSLLISASEAEETFAQGLSSSASENTLIKTPGSLINRANLRLGSRGRDVSELQATLKLLGFYAGVVDGFYGESTAIAVSRFQTAAGLSVDGIVGTATWNQLFPPPTSSIISSTTRPTARPTDPAATTNSPVTANTLATADTSAAAFPVPQIASGNTSTSRPTALTVTSASSGSNNDSVKPIASLNSTENSADIATSSVELPVLRLGMQGSAVSRLQERLQAAGFFQGVIDGAFGPETQTAVKAAQRQYQLEADGVVGPATWSALLR